MKICVRLVCEGAGARALAAVLAGEPAVELTAVPAAAVSGDVGGVLVGHFEEAVHAPPWCQAASSDGPPTLLVAHEANNALLMAALEAGAHGFAYGRPPKDLLDAVSALARGEAWVPSVMLGGLLTTLVARRREPRPVSRQDPRLGRLTNREREVLVLLARGQDHLDVARTLVISPQTARTHIQNVLGKLGVRSRVEAVALAYQGGLMDPEGQP